MMNGWTTQDLKGQLEYDFEEKARLEAELKGINERIERYGKLYWQSLGFTVMPRPERLRDAITG